MGFMMGFMNAFNEVIQDLANGEMPLLRRDDALRVSLFL